MSKRKLLLADDSLTIQKVINLTFTDEGFDVFTVGSGTAVLNRIDDVKPDVVLADVYMPGLNGYEVCERIRNLEQFKNLPIILLVGKDENFDQTEATRVGANDFLIKQPFQSTQLVVEKVVSLIESAAAASSQAAQDATPAASAPDQADDAIANASDEATVNEEVISDLAAAPLAVAESDFSDGSTDDEMIETSAGSDFMFSAENPSSTGDEMSEANSETTESGFEIVENDQIMQNETNQIDDNFIEALEIEADDTVFATTARGEVEAETFEFDADDADVQETLFAEPVSDETQITGVEVVEFAEMPALNVTLEPEELTFASTLAERANAETAPEAEFETVGGVSDAAVEIVSNPNFIAQPAAPISNAPAFEIDLDDDSLLELDDDFLFGALDETGVSVSDTTAQSAVPVQSEANQSIALAPTIMPDSNQNQNQQLESFGSTAFDNLQFTPEIIEAIANKVVEKLSDKVIEKIAWEVVPDRFDLIVRKHIDKRER